MRRRKAVWFACFDGTALPAGDGATAFLALLTSCFRNCGWRFSLTAAFGIAAPSTQRTLLKTLLSGRRNWLEIMRETGW